MAGQEGQNTLPDPGRGDETLAADASYTAGVPTPRILANRYELKEELGRGGMGVVWKAFDTTLQRAVAIKVLAPCFAQDPVFCARLANEARTLAALHHPNIVAVYDVGDGFLVMELCSGVSLDRVIARIRDGTRALSFEERVAIVRQIAEALATAHSHGIIHRDVKPANVLLVGGRHVIVADFGLGIAAEKANEVKGIEGTASYMSPEQACGDLVGPASDCWSLGVLLFELFSDGVLPIQGSSSLAIRAKITGPDQVPSIRSVVPKIPEELAQIVAGLLRKDVNKRTHDVGAVASALATIGTRISVRAWRRLAKRKEFCKRELLSRDGKSIADKQEHYALTEEHRRLQEELLPLACEDVVGKFGKILSSAVTYGDREHLALRIFWRQFRRAVWRRHPTDMKRWKEAFTNAVGEERAEYYFSRIHTLDVVIHVGKSKAFPLNVRIATAPLVERDGRLVPGKRTEWGMAPARVTLPFFDDSCIIVTHPDYREVRYEHCPAIGKPLRRIDINLYTEEEIGGKGWCLVPQGWTRMGYEGKEAFAPLIPHDAFIYDFAVERDWVSVARYATYLATLSDAERRKRWPCTWPIRKAPSWMERIKFGWLWRLMHDVYQIPSDFFTTHDLPVIGISQEDGVEFAEYESHRTRTVIRILTSNEWERMAGGRIGWSLPSGHPWDPRKIANAMLDLQSVPVIGAYTIDPPPGESSGVDVAFCGARNPMLLSLPCTTPRESLTKGVASGLCIARSGGTWNSGPPMIHTRSRIAPRCDQKLPGFGIRLMAYPQIRRMQIESRPLLEVIPTLFIFVARTRALKVLSAR